MHKNTIEKELAEIRKSIGLLAKEESAHYGEIRRMLKQILTALPRPQKESGKDDKKLFEEAKKIVIDSGRASTSFLQRRLGLGYAQAAKIIDKLETEKIIGEAKGAKPRKVLGRG